jgi:hypothetical protein
MRKIFAIGLICLVAACGANGDPLKPRLSLGAQGSNVGVGVGAGGASIRASEGPVGVSVGL